MHHLARFLVQQDVVPVSVAEPEHMAEDRDGGRAARVGEAAVEPFVRVLEAFGEEVAEDGVEVFGHLAEDFDALVDRLGLGVGDVFAARGGL